MTGVVVDTLRSHGAIPVTPAEEEWTVRDLPTARMLVSRFDTYLPFEIESPMEITVPAGETEWHFRLSVDGVRVNVPVDFAHDIGYDNVAEYALTLNDTGITPEEASKRLANNRDQFAQSKRSTDAYEAKNTFFNAIADTLKEYAGSFAAAFGVRPGTLVVGAVLLVVGLVVLTRLV